MRQQVLLEKLSKGRQQISKPYIQLTHGHRSVYTFPRPDEVVANGARQSNKKGVSPRMYSA